jgi:hypothetical protein
MKKHFLFILLFIPLFFYSQKQGNVWYFADSCELDFNSGSPVVMPNGNISSPNGNGEGTATISDSIGKLLFYANGRNVWNRIHQVMPNGYSLLGGASSTQAAFIIPIPGSDSLFYLFTTDEFQNNLVNGLRYNVVDMCLDNGLGDITPGKKNILLLDTVAEKMAGTNHANGTDYWLVTHKFYSDAFYSFHISASGIDTVISHVGIYEPNLPNDVGAAIGQMKISPDGTKLALAFCNTSPEVVELFDFDNNTGIVSNEISLPTNGGEYGISFSPDNTKLYVSTLNSHSLFEYYIASGNPNQIIASKLLIYNNNYPMAGIQLGPDGKIYCVDDNYLDVIDNPNGMGNACNFTYHAIYLGGHHSFYGITNFIDSYHYNNTVPSCNDINSVVSIANDNSLSVFPNPFQTVFTISDFSDNKKHELKIYNTLGEIVRTVDYFNGEIQIDMSEFSDGVYFLAITTGMETRVKKIVKMN